MCRAVEHPLAIHQEQFVPRLDTQNPECMSSLFLRQFCKKYMGQFPVISITLKDVLGDSYEDAYFQLAGIVADKVNEYGFLKDSPALNDDDKDTFSKLSNKDFLIKSSAQTRYYITKAIASLSLMLSKHFNKQVYILSDEYDVPLAKAHRSELRGKPCRRW